MDLGLDGRVAIVTGGNRGIGRAICETLVREGARVAVVGRDAQAGEAAVRELGHASGWFETDIGDDAAVARMVEGVLERFGQLDIVVNNAGRFSGGPIDQIESERWLSGFDTKTVGAVRVATAAIPHLRASDQARVVNISGTSAVKVVDQAAITALANSAILTFTAYLAHALKSDGVLVNCVIPGHTLTDVWRDRAAALAADRGIDLDSALEAILDAQGFRHSRWGRPAEVAQVVAFLVSRQASFVSGSAIKVDGAQVPTAALI